MNKLGEHEYCEIPENHPILLGRRHYLSFKFGDEDEFIPANFSCWPVGGGRYGILLIYATDSSERLVKIGHFPLNQEMFECLAYGEDGKITAVFPSQFRSQSMRLTEGAERTGQI